MSLLEYDSMRSAYVIWVAIFISLFFVIIAYNPKRETVKDLSIINAVLRILPIPPLVGAWIFTILPLVQSHDQAYYYSLGSKFMIINYTEYLTSTTVDEIVALGEGLTYSIGFYALLAFLILSTVHYVLIVMWSVRPEIIPSKEMEGQE
jgi:hypothetical protein